MLKYVWLAINIIQSNLKNKLFENYTPYLLAIFSHLQNVTKITQQINEHRIIFSYNPIFKIGNQLYRATPEPAILK